MRIEVTREAWPLSFFPQSSAVWETSLSRVSIGRVYVNLPGKGRETPLLTSGELRPSASGEPFHKERSSFKGHTCV